MRFVAWLTMLLGLVATASFAQTPPTAPITAPVPPTEPANTLVLALSTGGNVKIQLRPDKAPGHIDRIKTLTRAGFYDGLLFHRVIDGFMAQTGDPQGTGQGGSPLPDLKAEFNDLPHLRGAVSMARTDDPNSANSQFFITFDPVLRLDGKYTVFGRVISGMPFVDTIVRGEPPATPSRIVKAWIESDGPNAARVPIPFAAQTATPPAAAASPTPVDANATPAPAPKKKRKKRLGIF
jgi:cyclophilin family peptidyl-prolyl cis-trans isomerase